MAPTFENLFVTPARVVVPEGTARYQEKPEGTEDQGHRDEN
ncbi:hypothetical protein ABT390_35710 [Streptomyces aurantiacus]|uniref:Uncharacterized protein n=1 Tax=Streptomyces aurantiacus JA 4570 TaxID=1286094 RepID=S3ZP64_9ACTN|nr:hypothetical protein [Streptomyces aurantiacus]EPH45311.1 hypothetical protein STRAU_1576 [Streptomyces aurantiacus JA 4570]